MIKKKKRIMVMSNHQPSSPWAATASCVAAFLNTVGQTWVCLGVFVHVTIESVE